MANLAQGDFGEDFSGRPVTELLQGRWEVTIALVLTAFTMQCVLGLLLGSIGRVRKGKWPDVAVLAGTTALLSVPLFVVAFALQIVVGVELGWLPIAGAESGWPRAYILPGLVIALIGLAPVARLTRTTLIENAAPTTSGPPARRASASAACSSSTPAQLADPRRHLSRGRPRPDARRHRRRGVDLQPARHRRAADDVDPEPGGRGRGRRGDAARARLPGHQPRRGPALRRPRPAGATWSTTAPAETRCSSSPPR